MGLSQILSFRALGSDRAEISCRTWSKFRRKIFKFSSILLKTNQINPKLKTELRSLVDYWQTRHQLDDLPFLFFTKSVEFVNVYDGRPDGDSIKYRFEGPASQIIIFCNESAKNLDQIQKYLEVHFQKCLEMPPSSLPPGGPFPNIFGNGPPLRR